MITQLGNYLFLTLAKWFALLLKEFPFVILKLGEKYTLYGIQMGIYNLFVLLVLASFFLIYFFIIHFLLKLIKKLELSIKENFSELFSKIIIYLIAIFWIYINITGSISLLSNLNYGGIFRYSLTIVILLINLLYGITNYKYGYVI